MVEPDDEAFLALLAWIQYQQDHFGAAIITLRQRFPLSRFRNGRSPPRGVWRMLYPVKYSDSIERYSKDHEVDPYRRGSSHSSRVHVQCREIRSSSGARGLMQIMPNTGRNLAREHNRAIERKTSTIRRSTSVTEHTIEGSSWIVSGEARLCVGELQCRPTSGQGMDGHGSDFGLRGIYRRNPLHRDPQLRQAGTSKRDALSSSL